MTVLAAGGQEAPGGAVVTTAGAAAVVGGQPTTGGDTATRAASGLCPAVSRRSSMGPGSPWAELTPAARGREQTARARRW